MSSLQPAYLTQLSFGANELAAIHRLEARGRQDLFLRQYPEQLNTLRTHAQVESTESSNRIEGIVAAEGRVRDLVVHGTQPRDRSEQEIAGYRDALQLIHESHADMRLTENVIRQLHQMLYRYQPGSGGHWKSADNQIVERHASGQVLRVRFTPTSAVATPEAMSDLVTHCTDTVEGRLAEPLVLLPLTVLDFLCVHRSRTATAVWRGCSPSCSSTNSNRAVRHRRHRARRARRQPRHGSLRAAPDARRGACEGRRGRARRQVARTAALTVTTDRSGPTHRALAAT
jgi:hypothetical protein